MKETINKNDRIYIREWFNNDQQFKDGDIIEFEMPSFCSGDYEATIYIDTDGDPYIDKSFDYYIGCRDLCIKQN
jgi:signal peptidase I